MFFLSFCLFIHTHLHTLRTHIPGGFERVRLSFGASSRTSDRQQPFSCFQNLWRRIVLKVKKTPHPFPYTFALWNGLFIYSNFADTLGKLFCL